MVHGQRTVQSSLPQNPVRRNQGIGVEYSGSYTAQQPLNYMDDYNMYMDREGLVVKPISAADAAGTGQFGWGAKMDGSARSHF